MNDEIYSSEEYAQTYDYYEPTLSSQPVQAIPVSQVPVQPTPTVTLGELLNKADEKLKGTEGVKTNTEVEKSKKVLENVSSYIQSQEFDKKCEDLSKKHNIPKKQIAKNFATKCLATISDVLHIAIGGIECAVTGLVNIIGKVLSGGANLICNIARNLVRIVTLNQTRKAL